MNQTDDVGKRIPGCQSTNHSECYGELWQCAACGKTVCYAEGTDDHPELCDACWAKRFAHVPDGKQIGVALQEDGTFLVDCACSEATCATWLLRRELSRTALTPDGVLTVEDSDGLCVSILLPTWLDVAMRTALIAHGQPPGQGREEGGSNHAHLSPPPGIG